MNHDRLNLPVRGSRRHGILFTGNRSVSLHLVCLTPRSFVLEPLTFRFEEVFG